MSEAEVAAGGAEVAERLAACSFRGAARVEGVWRAVPMCEMNAVHRESIYDEQIVRTGKRRRAGLPLQSADAPTCW